MSVSYINQLGAIGVMLNSPVENEVEDAYNLLFELWQKYSEETDFNKNLAEIAKEHPNTAQEFTDRLELTQYPEKEKDRFLNRIRLFYTSDQSNDYLATPKSGIKLEKAIGANTNKAQEKYSTARPEDDIHLKRLEFSLSGSVAGTVAILVTLSTLIGGLSASFNSSGGIILAFIVLVLALSLFIYNVLKPK